MNIFIKSIGLFLSLLMCACATTAQQPLKKIETAEFTVAGVCDMCKERIEEAALIKGVKLVEWNKEAQLLKVIYNTKKTDETTILTAVANAGHDTEKVKAPDAAYQKLPACCAYRDGVEVH